jgi:3-phosphoshikimate 1-carboxyvinyltransferase
MTNLIKFNNVNKSFNKTISIEGDKSLSIRWALIASQASGKSVATNLLKSEDVLNTLKSLNKLGIKSKFYKNKCILNGLGLNGFKYRNNVTLNAGNSGTFARLILGLLIHSKKKIKIIGDKSLSNRDFLRVIRPLEKFGAKFKSNNGKLPIIIEGITNPKPIKFQELKGSAQCKSAVMLAALNTNGQTKIKAKKSRNHTELLFRNLKIPIQIRKNTHFDFINIKGKKNIKRFNYKVPSDISSSAFFIALTILSKNSKLKIKNVNINPSRTGILKILKLMDVNVVCKNIAIYRGEKIADIYIKSSKHIKPISCPSNLNSSAIDEFLILFLIAAKANGISHFKDLSELNQKESPRLKWGSKILSMMGIKNVVTDSSIKIYGNPNLQINKKIIIKNYLKDHRVFMTSVIAALTFGGEWIIHDKDSIKTSFPSFLKIINKINK